MFLSGIYVNQMKMIIITVVIIEGPVALPMHPAIPLYEMFPNIWSTNL